MKKQWNFILVMLMAMAIMVIGGCGGGGGGGSSSGSTDTGGESTATHPYFMTAVGSNWTYSDGSTEKVTAYDNGSFTMESVDGTYKDVLTMVVSGTAVSVSSVKTYENNMLQGTATFSPAWKIFPSSTTIGFSETQSVSESSPAGSSSNSSTLTVMGVETVTVTAGTFQNVLKIRRTDSYDSIYIWLAPGIGVIKEADAATNVVLRQLVAYSATAPESYSVSGTITSGGSALDGVIITLSGSGSTTTTSDSSGNYTFSGTQDGSYTVTPSKNGYTFTPTNQSVTVNGEDLTDKNFTATVSSTTGTSLLDISNWDIGRGTAVMSNGMLTVGATHGDLIRTKQTYNQPVAFTFRGFFPDTALSYHSAGIGQAPLDTNGYPTVNSYAFWTRWENQNSLFMVYPGVVDPVPSILAATKINGYFYGDFKIEWKNNAVAWYFNGSKVGEQPFTSTNPVYFYVMAYDRQFIIESISVSQP
jgi:hypothetical protein